MISLFFAFYKHLFDIISSISLATTLSKNFTSGILANFATDLCCYFKNKKAFKEMFGLFLNTRITDYLKLFVTITVI